MDVEKSDIMFPTSFRRLKHHVPPFFSLFLFCAQRILITTHSITFDCLIWEKNLCVVYLFFSGCRRADFLELHSYCEENHSYKLYFTRTTRKKSLYLHNMMH